MHLRGILWSIKIPSQPFIFLFSRYKISCDPQPGQGSHSVCHYWWLLSRLWTFLSLHRLLLSNKNLNEWK